MRNWWIFFNDAEVAMVVVLMYILEVKKESLARCNSVVHFFFLEGRGEDLF